MSNRRHGPSEGRFIVHGLILLVAIAVVAGLVAQSMRGTFADTAHVSARMREIGGGVVPGSDVKLRGVIVGRVAEIGGKPGAVVLDLELAADGLAHIPGDVTARILPASVFGTSYVELTNGNRHGGDAIADGDVIRQDTTGRTLELQRALDSIDQLVKALGPADLSVVLHAIAGSLDGRGAQIGDTLDKLDHLLSVINPRISLLRDDLRLLADNVRTVRQIAPDLLDSLEDTAVVARGLVTRREQLAALLASAIALVNDADTFLDRTERAYVRAILASAGVTDAVYDNRAGVSGQVRGLDKLLTRILTVSDGGPLRIELELVDAWRHQYYTPADCPRYGAAAGANCGGSR